MAVRSAILDRLVSRFITAHADAVAVELGCGLETRMHRVSPPAGVDWYDTDLPDVIAVRRQVIPELEPSHLIATTDPGWLQSIPRHRPTIIVADGVLGFLTETDNRQILGAITDHFTAGGELVFNAYTRIAARLMGSMGVLRSVGIPKGYRGYGFDDPHAVEQLNPQLTYIEEQLGAQAPEAAQFAWPTRMIAKVFARWCAQVRRGVWIVRSASKREPQARADRRAAAIGFPRAGTRRATRHDPRRGPPRHTPCGSGGCASSAPSRRAPRQPLIRSARRS